MKSLAKLILVLFLFSSLAAANAPQEDGKYLEKLITYTLNADGSWVKDVSHKLRYDTYYASRRLAGETFVTYNPKFQELKVLSSVTTMKDGKKVTLPDNALNEILPHDAYGQPEFSHLREMVITHTGLERGAVVDLHYQILTKPGFKTYFSGLEFIKDRVSTETLTIKVEVPNSKEFYYGVVGLSVDPKIQKAGDMKAYTFTFDNLEPAYHEPLDSEHDQPYLVFSTVKQWAGVFAFDLEKLAISSCYKKQIDGLKLKYKDPIRFCIGMQKMVAVDMDGSRLGSELTGSHIRCLEEVYKSNYGTGLEKALLLERGFSHLGAKAELLAVAIDNGFAKDVASMQQVDQFLVKVNVGGTAIYLDPAHEQEQVLPYHFAGRQVYNVSKKAMEALPVYCACGNSIFVSGDAVASKCEKGNKTDLLITVKGRFVPYTAALTGDDGDLAKKLSKLLDVDDLAVKKILMLTPGELRVLATAPGNFIEEAATGLYRMGKMHIPGMEDDMAILSTRNTALHIDTPFKVHYDLTIDPNKKMTVDYLAPAKKIENDLGYYRQEVVKKKNGTIAVKLETAVTKNVVLPKDYSLLRQVVANALAPEPMIILKK